MKKFVISMLLAIPAIVFCNSCSRQEPAQVTTKGDKIQLRFSAPATRTLFDDEGYGRWCDSDKIAVWTSNGESGKFAEFSVADAASGIFTGSVDEGYSISSVAVYPAVIANGFDGTTVSISLPSEYSVSEATSNLPMIGWFSSTEDPITLQAVGSAIEISYQNIPLDAVALRFSASSPIAGNFSLEDGDMISGTNATVSTVTINFPSPEEAENLVSFYVPVPEGSYTTASTVALLDGDGNEITVHNTPSLKHFAKTVTVGEKTLKRLPAIPLPIDYYKVWENGGSITIGGEKYSKAGTGFGAKRAVAISEDFNLRTSAYLNGNPAQALFLESEGDANYFGSSAICQITNPTIVIGRYSDEKVEFRPLMQLRFQTTMLLFKNLLLNLDRIDGSSNAGYFITNVGATVTSADKLVIDDCKITNVKKQLYYQGSATKSIPINRITIINSTIGIGVTSNLQVIYLADSDVLHLFKQFEFNNNIVYNASNGQLQLFCWKHTATTDATKTTWNAYSWDNVFVVRNNIFYNLPSGSGYITNWQISSLNISKNIFCCSPDYAQASYLFGTFGANQLQSDSWLDVNDNIAYGTAKGFYYALNTSSVQSTYMPSVNNHTKITTFPFEATPDLDNVVFKVIDEFASYGPQK